LTYRPVEPADLEAFSGLVRDEPVRRYMMDGKMLPPEWSAAQIRASQEMFDLDDAFQVAPYMRALMARPN
jgi:hypothetical protein